MLKGVNKLIIEVSNPESDLFEKAIFFVRPEKSDTAVKEINQSARDLMNRAGQTELQSNKTVILKLLKLLIAFVAGALAAGLAMMILV